MSLEHKKPAARGLVDRKLRQLKIGATLSNLPIEVLDMILEYTLQNTRDFEWLTDARNGRKLFVQPILQTCTKFRQQSFQILGTRCIWISVTVPGERLFQIRLDQRRLKPPLMPVPECFWHLISNTAPRLVLSNVRPIQGFRRTHSIEHETYYLVMPFNFITLIRQFELFNVTSYTPVGRRFYVAGIHLQGPLRSETEKLVLFAMSLLYDIFSIHFEIDSQDIPVETFGQSTVDLRGQLLALTDQVKSILHAAESLEKAGHIEESSVLALSGIRITSKANLLLPVPRAWSLGELDEDAEQVNQAWLPYPGRCITGNRLRQLLFKLEVRSYHAYTYLIQRYGATWCRSMGLRSSFSDPERSLFSEPRFTWLGASMIQRAKLHFARARILKAYVHDMPETLSSTSTITDSPTEHTRLLQLREAMIQFKFAALLDPDKDRYVRACVEHECQLGPEETGLCEKMFLSRLVFLRDGRYTTEQRQRPIVWIGEREMVSAWGGQKAVDEWLPMAQKGIDPYMSIDEWLDRTTTAVDQYLISSDDKQYEQEELHYDSEDWGYH